jgi:hypothetical protein
MSRCKLGADGLPENDAAELTDLRNARSIGRWTVIFVYRRAVFGRHVHGVDHVFDADRDAVQP